MIRSKATTTPTAMPAMAPLDRPPDDVTVSTAAGVPLFVVLAELIVDDVAAALGDVALGDVALEGVALAAPSRKSEY
jgi:hypothetical protein